MKTFEGTLTIDAKADNKTLDALAKEILTHLQEIKEITVDDSLGIESSALFSLLASIRKTAPHIKITFLDTDALKIEGIGLVSLDLRG